ncbi:type IV pilus secretin PilQ [Moraxella cuniculi]|uniref:Type IV pilus biogenesis and competence protein pilQ n=1 Tax=Moraxella cuniculi TaxID=34061 RepID=A0A448GVL5_9GAMM|nr:type IV pilus secretin PilQ [Moraxella cuniculi]VEG12785.1 Type IV pilus biogenesis and competence protein pilQ precursor [Moraxella cuniculi]
MRYGSFGILMAGILATTAWAEQTKNPSQQTQEIYQGKPISLEFADIPVRAVFDILASFTGINIITDDSVTGNISIRLTNIAWDQAFDIIVQMQNLSVLKTGNVWIISSKSIKSNQPVLTQYIRLHYAQAEEVAALIRGEKIERSNLNSARRGEVLRINPSRVQRSEIDETTTITERGTLLSERGTVTIDKRTNTLIIQDVAASIENIKALIANIDVAVDQVMIEARIVSANESFGRQLGISLGAKGQLGNVRYAGSRASLWSADSTATGTNVNLGVGDAMGRIAFGLLNLPQAVLDLELSAMQAQNAGELISTPKVLTADKQTARISSGVQIPYQETTSSGATATTFKEASLILEVTPSITPDGKVALRLSIKNGNPVATLGRVAIQEDAIETNVIVENGQTVVLGGIYRQNSQNGTNKVPKLGDVPVLGRLFRHDSKSQEKSELLIFITPTLLKQS